MGDVTEVNEGAEEEIVESEFQQGQLETKLKGSFSDEEQVL